MIVSRLLLFSATGFVLAGTSSRAPASDDGAMTSAVYSEVRTPYHRTKLEDGTFKPEYYAFSYGGIIPGTVSDTSMEKLEVATLNQILEQHLARQNYLLAPDAKSADLLLVINWGRTIAFDETTYATAVNSAGRAMNALQDLQRGGEAGGGVLDPALAQSQAVDALENELIMIQMQNQDRRRANEKNARLLGYLQEVNDSDDIRRLAGGETYYNDLVTDLEDSRYYVIVSAYNFRKVTAEKKTTTPLWITKISIRAQGNRFDDKLAELVARMGRYFGRSSNGLVRKFEGTVEFGEATVIGIEEETSAPERPPRADDGTAPAR